MTQTVSRADTAPVKAGPASRFEAAWVIGGLVAFFLLNFFTAEKTPAVWCDEVMYQDPAVNLYQGHGFTSGAWFLQPSDRFWAGNVPFFQVVLFGWFKLFGFSLLTVRSFHYAAFTLAILAIWAAIRRLNIIRTPAHRLLFCVLACLCTPEVFVYRFARPESLGMLLVAGAFLTASLRARWLALILLAVLGALLTCTGLQLVAYAVLMTGLLWIFVPRRFRLETVCFCAGCAAGVVFLYLLYSKHGVWKDFVDCIRHHTIANEGTQYPNTTPYGAFAEKFRKIPLLYFDYSFLPLLAMGLWMSSGFFRAGIPQKNTMLFFGILSAFLVPLCLDAVGIFPIYYLWMAFLPLAAGVCAQFDAWSKLPTGAWARYGMAGLLALACFVGLPRRLLAATFEWRARSYQPVMELAAPFVSRDKFVLCEFPAYYAAKQNSAEVVLPNHIPVLTGRDRARLSTAILSSGDAASLARDFGGTWRDTGAALDPPVSRALPGFREALNSSQYHLRIFVRETAAR